MVSGYLNETTNTKEYVVSIPFKGNIEKGSVFTAVYDQNGQTIRTVEYQFTNLNEKVGQAKIWKDAKLDFKQNFNKADYEGSEISTKSFSCLNDCLASLGVANWVLGAIAVGCAAACTTVVLCGPCIQGMGLFLYFELDYCLDKCY